jgi:predicted nucleic acid-binding protein
MKVIDASGLAALAFAEPQAERVIDAIDNHDLAAPRLLPFELADIALNKMRRRPDAVVILAGQLRDGLDFPVQLLDVDFEQVFALAAAHDLTAHDASYLWVARVLDADLVTLDRKLATAARR